jgi:hypothetical protein
MGAVQQIFSAFGGAPPPWTPADITTKLWLDAADTSTITSSSGSVSAWVDKSGNNYNFTQATGSAQPKTGITTQNGLNVLDFDGNNFLQSTIASSNWTFLHYGTVCNIFVVAKFGNDANPNALYTVLGTSDASSATTSRGANVLWDDRSSATFNNRARYFVSSANGSGLAALCIDASSGNDAFPANSFGMLSITADTGNATAANRCVISVNGGTGVSDNARTAAVSSSNPAQTLRIGRNGGSSFPMVGSIAEIVIVLGAMSSTDFDKMEGYLAWKWGIQDSLASGHPYKSAAPTK